jgi:hypothetical protein
MKGDEAARRPEDQQTCPHLRVQWETTVTADGMSGWWYCDTCLAPFTLKPAVMARCEVCRRDGGHHDTTPHIHRRKPDLCLCSHERDEHEWVLPCGCRTCQCSEFVGRDEWSCDHWLKGPR